MSLQGANLICLTHNGKKKKVIKPEGKFFRFGYYTTSNYILENAQAKGIHCEIYADGFNRITIVNYCNTNPIIINGFPVMKQRPLFHGNKIKIFDDEFIWQFPKRDQSKVIDEVAAGSADTYNEPYELVTPPKQQMCETSEQPSLSEPWRIRKKYQINRRLSVQSFAYYIGKEEIVKNNESVHENLSAKTITCISEIKENIPLNQITKSPNLNKNTPVSVKNKTSLVRTSSLDYSTPIKSTITDNILIDYNTSIYKDENMSPQAKLRLCEPSDVLVTSYSPKTRNINQTLQSFAIIKSNKITKSIYGTPRSILSEQSNSPKLMSFSTPQRNLSNTFHSSMHLIDLTTPAIIHKTPVKKQVSSLLLKSALKNAHKSTTKSAQKVKTIFDLVLEEPYGPLNNSAAKETFLNAQSSASNIKSTRKSLSMSVNVREQSVNTLKNLITPANNCLTRNELNKNLNISTSSPLSIDVTDSSIEMGELSIRENDEESIIEVTDDSIYTTQKISGNEIPQKVTPNKKACMTSQSTSKPIARKNLLYSSKKLKISPKVSLATLKLSSETSLSKLSSCSKLNFTTPLRRSSAAQKIKPRNIEKQPFSFRTSCIGLHISPLKRTALSTSTPLRTNLKQQKFIAIKDGSLTSTANKTPKPVKHAKQENEDQELANESELNQTFTVTEARDEENQIESEEIINKTQNNIKNTTSNQTFFDKDIVNLVGVKELLNTPKNNNRSISSAGITELCQTPIKHSDNIIQLPENCSIQSILIEKIEDEIFTSSKKLKDASLISENTSSPRTLNIKPTEILKSTESHFEYDTGDNDGDYCEQIHKKDYFTQITSLEDKFDKIVGKVTSIKQYTSAKKITYPEKSCLVLNDPETPKTDIQEWIDNLNESFISSEKIESARFKNNENQKYQNIGNEKILQNQNLKNDESELDENKICPNMTLQNAIISTNERGIGVLQEIKSVFSEKLVISDKSDEEDSIAYQSTPNQSKLSSASPVTKTRPTTRSSRHLNKSYGCTQCPTILNFKNRLEATKQEREMELAFENFNDQPNLFEVKAKTPNARRGKMETNRKTLGNQTTNMSFDLEAAKGEREIELAFEHFIDQPNLPEEKAKTPNTRRGKIQTNRKSLSNQTVGTSFDLKLAKQEREMELAFENFSDQPKLPEIKAKTPSTGRGKIQTNRKTLGNQTTNISFDLQAAKEERDVELAFENFNDQPHLPEVKAKTPNTRRGKIQTNRKSLSNQTVGTSFDLKLAKQEREMELAFENFSDQPKLPEIKAKTPSTGRGKIQTNRKTLGNQTTNISFDLQAAKEERDVELAFENFNDQPHLPEVKAKTPNTRRDKIQTNRKTLGNQTVGTSFDLKLAKQEREMELAFENFSDQPKLPEIKAKTPSTGRGKIQTNRKTLGNQTTNISFDLQAAKEERDVELAFENFNDQPHLPEVKAKTPNTRRDKIETNRKTLGNQTTNISFDLQAAKEEREMELAFENFSDQPHLPEVKAKTPNTGRGKIQTNRKTLGNQTTNISFDLQAAKAERDVELAFENFNDQPHLPAVKAKTPNTRRDKIQTNRKTLGSQTTNISFDLQAAKEEREMELAFENFNDQPHLPEVKAKTPNTRRDKIQTNRKTLGNQTTNISFDLQAAKEEREMELAFENFSDQPHLPEVKAKTPNTGRGKIQTNRKTLGNQTVDNSFDLEAAKQEREIEVAFENFSDQPHLLEVKAKTPNARRGKIQTNRKTLGNQTTNISFDLQAAKEEREMELVFENFNDQPHLPEVKAKTPNTRRDKIQTNRKTLGNQTTNISFDLQAAKEEREMELAFENFNEQPNLFEVKAKTPNARRGKIQTNRKTLGNQTTNMLFDLQAAKEERELELAFENFNDQPYLPEVKAKTPNTRRGKMETNRKTLGNQTTNISFDLQAAKEEREMELAFENFNDQPKLPAVKAKTPNARRGKLETNRKTLGNQTKDISFDLKAAIAEREIELAFENFNDQPNLLEEKAKTPNARRGKIQTIRKTLGNQTVDNSFDLEAAKQEREIEVAFENFSDQPHLLEVKAKTPNARRGKIETNRKTLGNQTKDISFDLKAAKAEHEMELAFENFNDQPNLFEVKAKTPNARRGKMETNRKTLGNQTKDISFDLKAAKAEHEMELAFENFNDQPNLFEVKAKTPNARRGKMETNRKTLGNQTKDISFDLKTAKAEREIELAFENFIDQPNLLEEKAKTPNARRGKIQTNRKTLGNQTVDNSFDLEAAKLEREIEVAFGNFRDRPNFVEVKAKTPEFTKAKAQNNRKSLGNQTVNTTFNLKVAKQEREMKMALEYFNDQPNLAAINQGYVNEFDKVILGKCKLVKRFGRSRKKSSKEEMQDKQKFSEEENVMLENALVKSRGRIRKQFKNIVEEVADKQHYTGQEEKEVVFSTPDSGCNKTLLEIKNPTEYKIEILENVTTNTRGKACKQSGNVDGSIKIQVENNEIKEATYEIKNTYVAELDTISMGVNNMTAKVIQKRNAIGAKKELIENTPVKGRSRRQLNNIVEEIEKLEAAEQKKGVSEITSAKLRSRTRKLAINMSLENKNGKETDLENIETTPVKARRRAGKKLEMQIIESEETGLIQSPLAKTRTRFTKQIYKTAKEEQKATNFTEEENEFIESTPAKSHGRSRKKLNIEEMQVQKEESEEEKIVIISTTTKVIESIPVKEKEFIETTPAKSQGRSRKKPNNIVEELQLKKYKSGKEEKELESTSAKGRGRPKKQLINITEKLLESKNATEIVLSETSTKEQKKGIKTIPGKVIESTSSGDVEFMESTTDKSDGRSRKKLNIEKVQVEKPESQKGKKLIENVLAKEKEFIESIPTKTQDRSRKRINTIVEEVKEQELDKEERTIERRTPAKGRGRRRKQLNNITEKLFDNKNDEEAELEINESVTSKSRVSSRKMQVKINETEKGNEVSTGTSTKGRGPTKNKFNKTIEEIQEHIKNEEEVVGKKLKYENKNEGEKQIVIQSNSVKKRSRKQQNIAVDNGGIDDDKENCLNKNTPEKSQDSKKNNDIIKYTNEEEKISKINIEEMHSSQISLNTRSRRKLKVISYFEENGQPMEILHKAPALKHGRQNKNDIINDININISDGKVNAQNKVERKNIKNDEEKYESNSSTIDEWSENLSIKTPILQTVTIARSKRKVADENDSSASEEMISSIRRARRGRIVSENKINSEDEPATVKPVKSTRGKRKLEDFPIESKISTNDEGTNFNFRRTRRRN